MRYIEGKQKEEALRWLDEAVRVAQDATCERAKCGAVIVNDEEIIGRGFNSPPGDEESERRCHIKKHTYDKKVTDKTCCVHAEQRAVIDALRRNPEKTGGAKLYFARFHPNGERRLLGGKTKPYCTLCSKMMFDVGLSEFILAGQEGICSYPTDEYNQASYDYQPG